MRIDSHQHFWKYDPIKDSWITENMHVIKQNFSPDDVLPMLAENNFDGCIAVQADQSEYETNFLLNLADQHDFIKGVVGWVNLSAPDIEERLHYFSKFPKLKGFRHIIQSEAQVDYILKPDFCRGISYLHKNSMTYDILIYPKHLKHTLTFVQKFPDQVFILNHIAKPLIKEGLINQWYKDLLPFKDQENVSCKIAGLATEADWKTWKIDDFQKYIDLVYSIFGPDRVMFGSDWPVCTLAASLQEVVEIVEHNTNFLTPNESSKLFGENCSRIYQLSPKQL